MLDRTQAPQAKDIKDFTLLPAQKLTLANGIPVTYFSGGVQPIVNLHLEFEVGKADEEHIGEATFMAKMIGEGTAKSNSAEISEAFEAFGAFWQVSASPDWTTVEVYCLSKHLPQILPVLCELLQEATFPEEEWATVQAIGLQQLRVNMEKSSIRASRTFKNRVFGGGHPYGSNTSEDTVKALTTEHLRHFYHQHLVQAPFRVFMSGLLGDKELKLLDNTLGRLTIQPNKVNRKVLPKVSTDKQPYYEEKEGAMQSSIRIGSPFFLKNNPEQVPFTVLNTILGGYFGSRLMQNIREEKGLSYGINSGVIYMKHSGLLYIQAEVLKDRKDEALSEIYKELQILKEELVSEKELTRVKNYRCGSLAKSITSPMSILDCHKAIWMYNLPADYYDTYTANLWRVTSEEVQALAQKYFTEDMVEVVVG